MEVKQFRVHSLQRRMRPGLGPQAAVLQTREIPQGLSGAGWARRNRVTAAINMTFPARFPAVAVPLRVDRHHDADELPRRGRGTHFGAG